MSFFAKVDNWFDDCGRAKRAKNDSSGTDRRTFLKGLGLVGGVVAVGGLVKEDDVFFEGEEPGGLPQEMKIVTGVGSGDTIASFTMM